MKRTIQAGRADDLRAKRQAYLEEKAARDAKQEKASQAYRRAERDVFGEVEVRVWDQLGTDTGLPLEISARSHWTFRDEAGIEIKVDCGNNPHKVPLCWHWQCHLDKDGNPQKETGSWSGMNAISAEDIEYLRSSVNVLEKLNNMDWATILAAELPKFTDYIVDQGPMQNAEVKQSEIDDAELAEAIGQNVLFAAEGNYTWIKIIRETPSRFVIARIPNYSVAETEGATDAADSLATLVNHFEEHYSYQVNKDTLRKMLVKPYVTKKY